MTTKDALEILCRNGSDVISREELQARLLLCEKEKRPLRVKAGFDPSAPDIHLGHTVLLRKLRQFQDLGHKVIFLIGDYTAMIGDPTGRSQTRPPLTAEEVKANAQTYQKQAFKILKDDPKFIEVVWNSHWLGKLTLKDFLEDIATRTTVARVLERDDFEKRIKENHPITIREFLYPLMQGYDSVHLKADIELGGSDQKFNLLLGRNLQRAFGQEPQIVMTLPLLVGLDGQQKMSKSLGNHIAVLDSPKDIFGKVMSIPDSLMESYYNLLTSIDGKKVVQAIIGNEIHPRDAKKKLALEICGGLYDEETALRESREFDRIFRDKQNPLSPKELILKGDKIWVVDLIKKADESLSSSDARRLLEQGGIMLDGDKITDVKQNIKPVTGMLLKVGKKNFVRLTII